MCSLYYICSDARRGQQRASDPLELELQVVVILPMWVLGTKLFFLWRSSHRSYPLSHLLSPRLYFEPGQELIEVARESQRSACLSLSSPRITCVHPHIQHLQVGAGVLSSGGCAREASVSLTGVACSVFVPPCFLTLGMPSLLPRPLWSGDLQSKVSVEWCVLLACG